MEALLEKEGNVESWNDERLDELSRRVDAGFEEMRKGFARMDQKFELVAKNEDLQFLTARFDRLLNTLLIIGGGLLGTVIASAAGVVVAVT
ncbi:MAG TPA: hypothetical protein VN732_05255 [Solirubrobacterales bacterium]|nr:hypothetical protein [Solirubrobacterales bacterium]